MINPVRKTPLDFNLLEKCIRKVIDARYVLSFVKIGKASCLKKDNKANLADLLGNEIMAKASAHTAHIVTAGGFINQKLC